MFIFVGHSCAWTIAAEPGQHIIVSWRLSSAGSWHSDESQGHVRWQGHGLGSAVQRKTAACAVTLVFIDSGVGVNHESADTNVGRNVHASGPIEVSSSSGNLAGRHDAIDSLIHVTTCSVGSRDEPRVIYASRTNRLQIRPTDTMLARLSTVNVDDVNWKPHLLEYQSRWLDRVGCT